MMICSKACVTSSESFFRLMGGISLITGMPFLRILYDNQYKPITTYVKS